MHRRLPALPFALVLALATSSSPALAQTAPATVNFPGGTTAVAAPPLPTTTDQTAQEAWIAECGRRIDAVNEGRDGPDPFRTTCAAWLDYFQRTGVKAKEAYANPPSIPVTMVPLQVMVPCKPAVVTRKVRYTRHQRDKRVRID
jgi:hypothetical protein